MMSSALAACPSIPFRIPRSRLTSRLPAAGRLGDIADPANDGGHFALLEHFGALTHDDVERRLPVPGPKQVLDALIDLASSEVP